MKSFKYYGHTFKKYLVYPKDSQFEKEIHFKCFKCSTVLCFMSIDNIVKVIYFTECGRFNYDPEKSMLSCKEALMNEALR